MPLNSDSPPGPGTPSEASANEERTARVLIVDDYADNTEMYTEYLNFAGFDVITADNGAAAIEQARAAQPDVILMDLSLPLMDGWQAIRLLKGDEETNGIPVIALTGHATKSHEQRARDAGCDDFVSKPCVPSDVERRIRGLLQGKGGFKRED